MFFSQFRNQIARGPVGAVAGAIGGGLQAAGTIGSLFGDSGDPAQPGISGYEAAPQWLKDKYQRFGTSAEQYFNSPQSANTNPVAELNPYQLSALSSFGGGVNSLQQELPQYMNPYNSFVTDEIRREYDAQRNSLLGGASDATGLNNSALGVQLAANEEARQRALAEANYNNYNQALGLRSQTLGQMLDAGNLQYQQSQNQMASQAQAPLQRLSNYGALLGQIPGTNSSIGPIAATPSFSDKLFGAGTSLTGFGNQYGGNSSTFGSLFGGGNRASGNASAGYPRSSGNANYPMQAGGIQYRY